MTGIESQVRYENGFELSGLLYLHPISENRVESSTLKNLGMFQKLCGKEALRKVILTTTMWSRVEEGTGVARENELRRDFWADMVERGSRIARFANTQLSAWSILNSLVSLTPQKMCIQHELIDLRKQLSDTSAGRHLYGLIEELVERQQEVIRRLKEELAKSSNLDITKDLLQELNGLREEREKAIQDLSRLNPSLITRLRRLLF